MAEAIKQQPARTENGYQMLLDKLSEIKREAYSFLNQALELDASKHYNEAVIIYRKSVTLINKAISFVKNENIDLAKSPEANKINQDLHVMLKKTLDRLELLEKDLQKPSVATNSVSKKKNNIDEYLLIGDEVLGHDNEGSNLIEISNNESNATQIYNIESGVQLFYIASDGSVSTPSYPTSLSVYLFKYVLVIMHLRIEFLKRPIR